MNLDRARVVLRPRGAAELLDLAALVCTANLRLLAPLALAVALPPALAGFLAHTAGEAPAWLVWLAAIATAGLLHAPFTVAAGELLFAPPRARRVPAVLWATLRRLPALLAAHLIVRLTLLAAASLILPLPWLARSTLFVHEVLLLERASPVQALRRSARLARTRGSGLALWLGLGSAPVAFTLGTELLGAALLDFVLQLGRPLGNLLEDGISLPALLGFHLSVAYTATARFLGYVDARTRLEGWDLQLRLTALAARARRAPGTRPQTGPVPLVLSLVLASLATGLGAGVRAAHASEDAHAAPAPADEVARARARALADPRLRFCHEDTYPLSPRELAWCELLPPAGAGDAAQPCPRLRGACAAGARAWEPEAARQPWRAPVPGPLLRGVLWALVAGFAGALAWLIARNLLERARAPEPPRPHSRQEPRHAPADLAAETTRERDPERLLARARAALAAGRPDQVVALVHAAALRALEQRELVSVHRASTSGDYLRALRARAPDVAAAVGPLLAAIEASQFGGQPPERAPGARLVEAAQSLLHVLAVRAGSALLLAVLPALLAVGCTSSPRGDWERSPSGHAAVVAFLREVGLPARDRLTSLRELDGETGQLVLLEDARLDGGDWDAVATWLARGGRLVLAPGPATLPAWLPAIVLRLPHEGLRATPISLDDGLRDQLGDLHAAVPVAGHIALTQGPPRQPLLRHGDRAYAFALHTDALAEVLVLADGALFQNAALLLPDNARLLAHLLGERAGTIDFVGGWTGQVAATPARAIQRSGLAPLVVQLLLAAAVLLWARGAMFAHPRAPPRTPRRRFVEHAHAVGLLYRRARARDHALSLCTAHALERLQRRLHRSGETGVTHVAATLARRTGRPLAEIARVLLVARAPLPAEGTPRARAAARDEREAALRALDAWLGAERSPSPRA